MNNKTKKFLSAVGIIIAVVIVIAVVTRINIAIGGITGYEAGEAAVARIGGGMVTDTELDWELWRWLWWVEVWHEGFVHEIYVHPGSGEIIRHEIDRR